MPIQTKRQFGRYYTKGNPFVLAPFKSWAKSVGLESKTVLEPFAGANNIITALQAVGYSKNFTSYDIDPQAKGVKYRDTLKEFPTGFEVCITNPPWLAKNSAHRRKLDYPETVHDDLYKHALDMCLQNCEAVGALIPATFLQSQLFLDRLTAVIFLHDQGMFTDTQNPVCLALFKNYSRDVKIYHDEEYIGTLKDLRTRLPEKNTGREIIFNDPNGKLGFVAFDSTQGPSIRFCEGKELEEYEIIHTSRMITRIGGDLPKVGSLIQRLNEAVGEFRNETHDVFLTPFKGLRKDGMYRRRMDYRLARDFIATHA